MSKLVIWNVVGARPNFMKIAPIISEMEKERTMEPVLVHTGQHYDRDMSDSFFRDLGIRKPDIYLGVGSGAQGAQTARIMEKFEAEVLKQRPGLILVVGDVNSTMACSLVGVKLHIPVAHVEAGLRSFDRDMPEEINRLVTDRVSDILFTTSPDANENLLREGIEKRRIFFVGNVMIDTLKRQVERAEASTILADLGLRENGQYAYVTIHRPSNVDTRQALGNICSILEEVQRDFPVVFPVHPRTRKMLEGFNMYRRLERLGGMRLAGPVGYLDSIKLMKHARFVMTDSGGIQEETTCLGVPCLTLRENTERPVTVTEGTNIVVGTSKRRILGEIRKILAGRDKAGRIPRYWDGRASRRIVGIIRKKICGRERHS
jgi:UDP-N-acetylglucosamine 2-epimerase (non-hydrolysing)